MTMPQTDEARKSIEIVELKLLPNRGNLKAFASVRLGGVVVHGCKIVQQPNQRPWVSLPQREYEQDGQKKYSAIIELSEPLMREVSRLVLAAWERGGGA